MEEKEGKGKEKIKEESRHHEEVTSDSTINWTQKLIDLGLSETDAALYHRLLREHRIGNLATLSTLSKEDMKNCGIRLGHLPFFLQLITVYEQAVEAQKKERSLTRRGLQSGVVEERAIGILSNLRQLITQFSRGLIDREVPCELLVLAILCKEHVLLLGPPGVAKSNMCQRMAQLVGAGKQKQADSTDQSFFFSRLLTRFTLPEELFGPVSLHKLKDDKHERVTTHYLPEARVAYLDEIFKAGSAVLNSLLTILNEREFDNGHARVKVPLLGLVGASNEYPSESGELQALYDRFLFRLWLDASMSEKNFHQLLNAGPETDHVVLEFQLDEDVIEWAYAQALSIPIPEEISSFLYQFWETLNTKGGYHLSPRRWRKIGNILRVASFCSSVIMFRGKEMKEGGGTMTLLDCALLQHLVWHKHHQKTFVWESFLKFFEERLKLMHLNKIIEITMQLQNGMVFGLERNQRTEIQKILAEVYQNVMKEREEYERMLKEKEEEKKREREEQELKEVLRNGEDDATQELLARMLAEMDDAELEMQALETRKE